MSLVESFGTFTASDGSIRRKTMTDMRRQLMLATMDGEKELAGTMHILSKYVHCDTILRWLVHHRITGKTLVQLLRHDLNGRVPALVNFVVRESKEGINAARKA